MKTIIHNKVSDATSVIDLQMSHNHVQELLGDEYTLITSRTDLSVIDGDAKIIIIENKNYSYNELMSLINKNESSSLKGE